MKINVTKADVLWSYIAQFFAIGSGIITLPLVLHFLSTEEIAMNYLMMAVSSMVALIDFGFAPQFGRNFSYVFSGVQRLEIKGIGEDAGNIINYQLLKNLIDVAKWVYMYMSIAVLLLMLTFGTWYIYVVTDNFTLVDNSLLIWLLYSVSTFFNIYYYYYSSLLIGRGYVDKEKKAVMASRIVYILMVVIFLWLGLGLIGICIANLIAPFVSRVLSYHYFYDKTLKEKLSVYSSSKAEMKELFVIIFYNAKRLGLNFIGGYAIVKFGLFIVGLYLVLKDVSSYGLMMQIVNLISIMSCTFFTSMFTHLTSLLVSGERDNLIKEFAWTINVFHVTYILLSLGLIFLGPFILSLIGSNAELPSINILVCYLIVILLEQNHSLFCTLITAKNEVPFFIPSLITGFFVCLGDIIVLQYTSLGLFGIVLVQGLVQLCYSNWYWPRYLCKELNVSYTYIIYIGFFESLKHLNIYEKKSYSIFNYVDNFALYADVKSECIKDSIFDKKPSFTIAIPTCLRAQLLQETLNSAINQDTQLQYEIMVVDNNPARNDETEELIKNSYANKSNLSYYKNKANIGMVGNWNRLFELAKSDWVVMLHDDDLLFSYALSTALSVINKVKQIDVLFHSYTIDPNYSQNDEEPITYLKLLPVDFRMDNMGTVVGATIKKETALSVGGFTPNYYPSHDYHFWAKLSLRSNVYRLLGRPTGFYRIEDNLSLKISCIDGQIKFDRVIMTGLLELLPLAKIRSIVFSKYMDYYLLNMLRCWVKLFYKGGDDKKILELKIKHRLVDSCISKNVFRIYHYIHYIYIRKRKYIM